MGKRITRVHVTVFATAFLGFVSWLASMEEFLRPDWSGAAFFSLLYLVSELLLVKLPKGGTVSFGFAVDIAALLVFGPFFASLLSIAGIVGRAISTGFSLIKSIFNMSLTFLTLSVSGFVYSILGGVYFDFDLSRDILPLVAAALTYLLINASFSTLIVAIANNLRFRNTWQANIKWAVPSFITLAPQGYLMAVVYKYLGVPGASFFFIPLFLARYSFNQYIRTKDAHVSVVQALATALEAKDPYTKGHSDRVAHYTDLISQQLELPEDFVEELHQAAAMHDIGKIGVPEEILNKPAKLSDTEYDLIKNHPNIGSKILTEVDFLSSIANVICYHHEWFNGSRGYPGELSGMEIPLGARILMVADCYDAMTSDRPYRGALSHWEAVNELVKGSGTQFDPVIVEAFLEAFEEGEASGGTGSSRDRSDNRADAQRQYTEPIAN